jgi:hypothetical protein
MLRGSQHRGRTETSSAVSHLSFLSFHPKPTKRVSLLSSPTFLAVSLSVCVLIIAWRIGK